MWETLLYTALSGQGFKVPEEAKIAPKQACKLWRFDEKLLKLQEKCHSWEIKQFNRLPMPSQLLDGLHKVVYKAAIWGDYLLVIKKYVSVVDDRLKD